MYHGSDRPTRRIRHLSNFETVYGPANDNADDDLPEGADPYAEDDTPDEVPDVSTVRPRGLLIAVAFFVLAGILDGCGGSSGVPATCAPCGDGALVCSSTVAECAADNGGSCATQLGAGSIAFRANGTYTQTTANGTTSGTWKQVDGAVAIQQTGAVVSALATVYADGAVCPYAVDGGAQ